MIKTCNYIYIIQDYLKKNWVPPLAHPRNTGNVSFQGAPRNFMISCRAPHVI